MQSLKLIIIWLIIFLFSNASLAEDTDTLLRQNRYTEAIRTILEADDSGARINQKQLLVLGRAYMQRGFFLKDLAAMQIDVGHDYYLYRDTSRTVEKVAVNAYFLGRYLYEKGKYQSALFKFQSCFKKRGVPDEYRQRSGIWAGACQAKLGKLSQAQALWASVSAIKKLAHELAYAQWRTGQKTNPGNLNNHSVEGSYHKIWLAAQQAQVEQFPELRYSLMDAPEPEIEHRVDAMFAVRFYDPAMVQILAYADFIAAMQAFSKVESNKRATFFAGICAFEAGEQTRALKFLNQSSDPMNAVYIGGIDYLRGKLNEAEQKWAAARSNKNFELYWLRVMSSLKGKGKEVTAITKKYRSQDNKPKKMKRSTAMYLGRALLRQSNNSEAVEILQSAYPTQFSNQPEHIWPSYLILLAHAKYLSGRHYNIDVLGHVTCLKDLFPVTYPLLDMVQGVMTPEDPNRGTQKRTDK